MTATISRNSVGFSELLDHAQQESHRWHDWFNQHSQALDVKIDIAGSATVRDLLSHIVFVDLLFAEWLLGESITPAAIIDPARFIDSIDKTSPDAIFSAAARRSCSRRGGSSRTTMHARSKAPSPRSPRASPAR